MLRYLALAVLCLLLVLISSGQDAMARGIAETADASVSSILPEAKSGTATIN
jgi:hypothetical protein